MKWQFIKTKRQTLGVYCTATPAGTVSVSSRKSVALRPSVRHRLGRREQINRLGGDLDMTFQSFVQHYAEDIQTRIKENTWATKDHIIKTKLLPYFGKLRMSSITPQQIIKWQNELLNYKDENGKPFSPVYLKTIQNQLSAIFNHAVTLLRPAGQSVQQRPETWARRNSREMLFWTKEEYLKFADAMMDKPVSFYAFEMLYWCGIREGELLALTPADFDFERQTVTISKSYPAPERQGCDYHSQNRKKQPHHSDAEIPLWGNTGLS